MDESTPFEVKYQNKTAILTVSTSIIECKIGNNVAFSIDTKTIRIIDIPKRQNLLINWQNKGKSIESISIFSKYVSKIKDAIILTHNEIIA